MQAKNKITKEKIESRNTMSFGKYKDCSKMDISVIKNTKELHSRYHACDCAKQFFPSKKCKEIKNKFKETLRNSKNEDHIKIETKDITLGGKRKRRRKCTLKKRRNKKTQKRHQSKRKVGKSKKNQKKRY